jgi:hypothetical protein
VQPINFKNQSITGDNTRRNCDDIAVECLMHVNCRCPQSDPDVGTFSWHEMDQSSVSCELELFKIGPYGIAKISNARNVSTKTVHWIFYLLRFTYHISLHHSQSSHNLLQRHICMCNLARIWVLNHSEERFDPEWASARDHM